jgi:hypothetical protein
MEDKEVVSDEKNNDDSESYKISAGKGVNSIQDYTDEKEEMEKGKYPVEHTHPNELKFPKRWRF